MTAIEVHKGDTVQLNLTITNNGEPFVPQNGEQIVFSVGRFGLKSFSVHAEDNIVKISHDLTKDMAPGSYNYDLRIYDAAKNLVATPIVGAFKVLGVVNDDI